MEYKYLTITPDNHSLQPKLIKDEASRKHYKNENTNKQNKAHALYRLKEYNQRLEDLEFDPEYIDVVPEYISDVLNHEEYVNELKRDDLEVKADEKILSEMKKQGKDDIEVYSMLKTMSLMQKADLLDTFE